MGVVGRMKRTLAALVLLVATARLCPAETRTVLVLPFENRSDRPDLYWISESFAETFSICLSAPGRYVISRQERNGAYEQLNLDPGRPLTLASAYKVGATLGADWAVTGDFNVEGELLTARARLLDAHRLRLAPALEATGGLADLVELQARLAWRLLATHDRNFIVGTEEDFRRRLPPIRLDAFERFIRGVLADDAATRVQHLSEAHRLNPADQRAAWELGRHYFVQMDYEDSASWLRKLNARDAHYWEALFLLGVAEFRVGREFAAEMALEALAEKAPLAEVWNNLGFVQARRGRFAEALESFERAFEANPTDADICFNLGAALWQLKRHDESVRFLKQARRLASEGEETTVLPAAVLDDLPDPADDAEEQVARDLLAKLRLKANYNARALRLLGLSEENPWQVGLEPGPAWGR